MTAATRPPTAARPSRLGSAARFALRPVRLALAPLRRLPRAVRLGLMLVAAGGAVAGAVHVAGWYGKRVRDRAVAAEWREFGREASAAADPAALRDRLDRILALDPADALAARRKAALDSGVAPADDPPMIRLLLRQHLAAGRSADAAREAAAWLAGHPGDQLARCVLADHALAAGDRPTADAHLDALARPAADDGFDPIAVLYSVDLLRRTGRDVGPLRESVAARLLPALGRDDLLAAPPAVLAALAGCYELAVSGPELPHGAAGRWVPVARLCERAVDAGDERVAARVATLGEPLAAALGRLAAAGQVTADEQAGLAKELEDRTRRAWAAVLAKRPADDAAYAGRVRSWVRSGDAPAAARELTDGLAACPDGPRLLALLASGLIRAGEGPAALDAVWAAAGRHPTDPLYWRMAADAARSAGRRDRAIEACQTVRRLSPDRADAAVLEAVLWVEAGRPADAVKAVAGVPDAVLAADPTAVRSTAHALAATGNAARLDAIIIAARAAGPASLTAVAEGLLDAPPTADRAARAVAVADDVLARWPAAADAVRLRAAAAVARLDAGPAEWDAKLAAAAAGACEAAAAAFPDDVGTAARLARVRLRGLNRPAAALAAAGPLRTAARLPADAAAVLGAVLLANGQVADAVRVLERAEPTAGVRVGLARAYHAVGRPADAAAALASAAGLPMTAAERAEYRAAHAAIGR